MSTATRRPRPASAMSPPQPAVTDGIGDQKIIIRGVDWQLYNLLDEAITEDQHIRLAYDGEDLEIMTIGFPHEQYRDILGKIVVAVSKAARIPARALAKQPGNVPR